MTKDELNKLKENLRARIKEIDSELNKIASENPLVRGDFDVRVEDIGPSQEDAAQEAGELDRRQALVDVLERERKGVLSAIERIESEEYGKCQNCSMAINQARLKAAPTTDLCMGCAKNPLNR